MPTFSPWHIIVLMLVTFLIQAPWWIIYRKAGFRPWWSLLVLVPLVGTICIWWFALKDWPALKRPSDADLARAFD
jgi:hypothetical protein